MFTLLRIGLPLVLQEAMGLKGDEEMKRFLKLKFGECKALVKLIEETPPHQTHRRRIEVGD